MPRLKELTTNRYLIIIVPSLALFFYSAVVASNRSIVGLEKSIFDFIYGLNIDLKPLFWLITQLGSVWVAAIGLVIFWWYKKRKLFTDLFFGGALAYALVQIAKTLVDRPRPNMLLPLINQKDSLVSGLGFPSGHTAMITVFCLTVQPYLPKRYRWLIWLIIAAVAVSRVYLGVHAPLDVIGGFAIGLVVAYSIRYLMQKS